jgi:hypothetical protein
MRHYNCESIKDGLVVKEGDEYVCHGCGKRGQGDVHDHHELKTGAELEPKFVFTDETPPPE